MSEFLQINPIDQSISASSLKKEYAWYTEYKNVLSEKYKGKFLVIKNKVILNSYNSNQEAIEETLKTHDIGTFIIQKCE